MAYQSGTSVCPRCGGTEEVRTVRELFHATSAAGDGFRRFGQPTGPQPTGTQPTGDQSFGAQPAQPSGDQHPGQPFGAPPPFGDPPPFAGQPGPAPSGGQPGQPGAGQQDGAPPSGPSSFGPSPYGLQPSPWPAQGPDQNQGRRRGGDDDDYDHYNVEGSNRFSRGGNRGWRDLDLGDKLAEDLGGAVLDAALGFAGRAIGRRMKKAFEERVVPAMQAKAAELQQQFEQQRGELDLVASRYPELRGCLRDRVVFVDGGTRTVPLSELTVPLTLAQADAVVARLR